MSRRYTGQEIAEVEEAIPAIKREIDDLERRRHELSAAILASWYVVGRATWERILTANPSEYGLPEPEPEEERRGRKYLDGWIKARRAGVQ